MPRVALVSSSFAPYVGGVEEHVARVAEVMNRRGEQVEVWTVDRGERLGVREVGGVVVRYLPTPLPSSHLRSMAGGLRRFPGALRAWVQAYRSFRPDLLDVQCFGPNGIYATWLARLTGTPLVVSSHGETFMDADDHFQRPTLLSAALRRSLRSADAVTVCSAFVADDLVRRFAARDCVVVPNGVDLDQPGAPELPDRPKGDYVFAVARLERVKGFDLLLDAFARIPGDATLVLGGDGPQRQALADQAADLDLSDRVVLTGRLDRAEVVSWMAGARVIVVPSRVEAFGITVLEGLRSGRPTIATSIGGPPDIIVDGRTGFLVDPTDRLAMAARIQELLGDRELADRIGAAGLLAVRQWTWSAVVDRYLELFRRAGDRVGRQRRRHDPA